MVGNPFLNCHILPAHRIVCSFQTHFNRGLRLKTLIAIYLLFGIHYCAARDGIRIEPDADSVFNYSDDFTTRKFEKDVVLAIPPSERWSKGELSNSGPYTTTLT